MKFQCSSRQSLFLSMILRGEGSEVTWKNETCNLLTNLLYTFQCRRIDRHLREEKDNL